MTAPRPRRRRATPRSAPPARCRRPRPPARARRRGRGPARPPRRSRRGPRATSQVRRDLAREGVDLLEQLVGRARPEADAHVAHAERSELEEQAGELLAGAAPRVRPEVERRISDVEPRAVGADLDRLVAADAAYVSDRLGESHRRDALREPPVPALGRAAEGAARGAPDPYWRPRPLPWSRGQAHVMDRPRGARMVRELVEKRLDDHVDRLVAQLPPPGEVDAERPELGLEVSRADAEDHATAGEGVERREGFGRR